LAIGGDLSMERLLLAYSNGIFPWPHEGLPMLWWSLDPRMVLPLSEFKPSKSLRQTIRRKKFEVKVDTDFEGVIYSCADVERKGGGGTWISDEIIDAFINLHHEGFAHSIETYRDGELVGGLYGVSMGGFFSGESMFHLQTDASKVAFYYLVEILKQWNFHFIDAQQPTDHLSSLGARPIVREEFLDRLHESMQVDTIRGNWGKLIQHNFRPQ